MIDKDSNRLNILHLSYWHVAATIDVGNRMAERHSVMFNTTRKAVAWLAGDEWPAVFDPRMKVRVERDRTRKNPMYYADRIVGLSSGLSRFGASVVHHQEIRDPFLNNVLLRMKSRPLIVTVHDPVPHLGENADRDDALQQVVYALRRRADWIIVHGEGVRDQLVEAQPELDPDRISVVLHPAMEYLLRWRRPQYVEKPGTILFFGRINEYKGLGVLMEAWQQVRADCPNARLVVAGTGFDLPKYKDKIISDPRCELIDTVIPTPDVARLFAESSIVVMPYLEGTQSGPLAIAVAFGKPVVITEVGGLPEAVDRDKSGLIVPPKDPKALAGALTRMLSNDELRRSMTEGAESVRTGRLGPEHLALRTEDIYRQSINYFKANRK